MSLKIGSIVNIKNSNLGKFWKGKVSAEHNNNYSKSLFTVKGINNNGHAVVAEHDLEYKDGEFWEL